MIKYWLCIDDRREVVEEVIRLMVECGVFDALVSCRFITDVDCRHGCLLYFMFYALWERSHDDDVHIHNSTNGDHTVHLPTYYITWTLIALSYEPPDRYLRRRATITIWRLTTQSIVLISRSADMNCVEYRVRRRRRLSCCIAHCTFLSEHGIE